jgi:hypothetical protein
MIMRTMHIIILLLYVVLCIPCFFIPDQCWLKKRIRVNSVSKRTVT